MIMAQRSVLALALCATVLSLSTGFAQEKVNESLEWQLPRTKAMLPFVQQRPIVFVSSQDPAGWNQLTRYWNPMFETAPDPITGETVSRIGVKIKLPLGLSQAPKVPEENSMTVERWDLGRRLYFDPVLSSDGTVSCASCHDPRKGFTDQLPVSTGIYGNKGGVSAPTVMNAAFNFLQFWDGRATSLEDQCQGPPQNPVEMFDGKGHAWNCVVERVRQKGDYSKRFLEAYGVEPTRDAIAMAIATYERTVLNGNSIHDRAEVAMRRRVVDEESTKFEFQPKDYEKVLQEAFAARDNKALAAVKLDDPAKVGEVAKQINHGRELFFGKARCSLCHVGQNFSDSQFHNLGVGFKDGKLTAENMGRYARLPTGHKNPEAVGAFKTPTLRGLVSTAPYLHDGSEATLEQVVEFYDRGGNANEYLSSKMRDLEAEKAYLKSKQTRTPYTGPEVKLFGADQKPIVPFALKLTKDEKADLVMFLRSLEGEVDSIVMGRNPKVAATK
jgi:cytochrome c peroxidase